MLSLFNYLRRFIDKHPKKVLYFLSAFFPMLIMLVVWAIIGLYPFGNRSLMSVDFGQQYISFFWIIEEFSLIGRFL